MIENMPFPEYLALDRASSHRLWKILRSPLKMRYQALNPTPPSESMRLGSLFHELMAGEKNYLVQPATANKRSNEGKKNLVEFLESATGHEAPRPPGSCRTPSSKLDYQIGALNEILTQSSLEIYTQDQLDTAERMRDELMKKSLARVLFDSGRAEVTSLQTDSDTGIDMKARFDWIPDKYRAVIDIKTCKDASHRGFSRDAYKYGYHLQAAFYRWMYELETSEQVPFFIVATEFDSPYESVIYEVDDAMLEHGMSMARSALTIYAQCVDSGIWPGYDWNWDTKEHEIQTLTLPSWVYEN